jgi:gephyrin
LIITLPGSVKAVKENMETLLSGDILIHALDLIKGGSGSTVHALLAKQVDSTINSSASNTSPSNSDPVEKAKSQHHLHHRHHRSSSHRNIQERDLFPYDPSLPGQ